MNILDENVAIAQRRILESQRIPVRKVGDDIGRKGMQDEEILPLLHQLHRPTFFTRDRDFRDRKVCHPRYCIVFLKVAPSVVAFFARRVLRHPSFDTQAKRMGKLIFASPNGLAVWSLHSDQIQRFKWID